MVRFAISNFSDYKLQFFNQIWLFKIRMDLEFYHFVDFVCMFHYRPIRALHEFCLNFDWSKLTRNVFFRKNLSAYFIFIIRDF